MAAASFGQANPGGTDPYPIESTLAQQAITSPAMAQLLLSHYQEKQQADANVYGHAMEQQHAFAKDQLDAQRVEARNKLISEMIGKPGANAFLAGGGIEGLGPAGGGTGNPVAWTGLGQAGEQHDFANNYEKIGRGTESLSRAGQDVALQQIPGYTNLRSTGAGQHSDITVEQMKADTALQLAAQRAKSAGAGGAGSGITTTFDTPNIYGGVDHHSAGRRTTQEQIDKYRQERGMRPVDKQTPPQDTPSDKGGGTQTGTSRTRLQQAPNTPQNAAAGVPAAQLQVLGRLESFREHPMYPDLVAGIKANGGKPIIRPDPDGTLVLYGASGQPLSKRGR